MTMLARSKPLENGGADHRDERGRFVYAPGPGRPRRAVEQTYLHTLSCTCPPERLAGIVENLVAAAERGDQSAIQILLRYLIGTPSTAPTLTQMAVSEMANIDPAEREAKIQRFQSLGEQYLDAIDL
jgi:hypothetical protein